MFRQGWAVVVAFIFFLITCFVPDTIAARSVVAAAAALSGTLVNVGVFKWLDPVFKKCVDRFGPGGGADTK